MMVVFPADQTRSISTTTDNAEFLFFHVFLLATTLHTVFAGVVSSMLLKGLLKGEVVRESNSLKILCGHVVRW